MFGFLLDMFGDVDTVEAMIRYTINAVKFQVSVMARVNDVVSRYPWEFSSKLSH